jgi:uncharacterized membrane protein
VSPLVGFHILAGTLAMLSGAAAMAVRKGDRWHVLTGNVFVVSMLCLSASGAFIGFARDQPLNGFRQVIPAAIRTPLVLYGPVLLVVVLMVYWMVRVRFAKRAAGLYVLRTKRFPDVPLALSE